MRISYVICLCIFCLLPAYLASVLHVSPICNIRRAHGNSEYNSHPYNLYPISVFYVSSDFCICFLKTLATRVTSSFSLCFFFYASSICNIRHILDLWNLRPLSMPALQHFVQKPRQKADPQAKERNAQKHYKYYLCYLHILHSFLLSSGGAVIGG